MTRSHRSPRLFAARFLAVVLVASALAGCSEAGLFDTAAARLAEFEWAYEVEVDIDPGALGSTLTDVPILIRLAPDRINYDAIRRDGGDIEFRDAAGGDLLPFEIDEWVPNGTSSVWVRVARIEPGSGARLRMNYGRWVAGSGNDPEAVWANGYTAVWHFSEAEPPFADSTGNANTATSLTDHTDPAVVAGIAGRGVDFSGSTSAALAVGPAASLDDFAPLSIEFATRGAGPSNNDFLFFRDSMFVRADGDWQTSPTLRFQHNFTGPEGEAHEPSDDLLVHRGYDWGSANWHVGAVTWDGTAAANVRQIYDNGVVRFQIVSRGGTGEPVDLSASTLVIGNGGWSAGLSSAYNGALDEVRLANVTRSSDWVELQARSLNDQLLDWPGATATQLREILDQ